MQTFSRITSILLLFCGLATEASGLTLASDGRAKSVIVVAADAPAPDRHAAAELAAFLKQVTGAPIPITDHVSAGQANLLVGAGAARLVDPKFDSAGFSPDEIVMQSTGDDLILAGGEPRGALYAVYTFLEDQVGCRWWTGSASFIPHQSSLEIGPQTIRYKPPFEYRHVAFDIAADPDWSVRNKCIGEVHGINRLSDMPERGGCLKFWPTHHAFFIVLPPDKYFAEHPDWYSLIDGQRRAAPSDHASLCLSNPEMTREYEKRLKEEIQRFPQQYAAIGYPDDSGYPIRCQCEKCVAIEREEGSPSGPLIRFANTVAAALKPDFPQMHFVLVAYHHTRLPPSLTRPRKNLYVQVCAMETSYARPMTDPRNSDFHDDVLGWAKICDHTYVMDYSVNFLRPLLPNPNLRVLAPNERFYAAAGVKGVWHDGLTYSTSPISGTELKAWLLAKLLWNPNLNEKRLIEEFTDGYYGPAGKSVRAYLDDFEDSIATQGDWLNLSEPPTARFLSLHTLCKAWADLQSAQRAVADRPELLRRVQIQQLSVRYAFVMNWKLLKDTAQCRRTPWPMDPSVAVERDRCIQFAKENGINIGAANLNELNNVDQEPVR